MAVYTELSEPEIETLIQAHFPQARLQMARGIEGGIENTNYFVDFHWRGGIQQYVLTLVEGADIPELPDLIAVQRHWADAGLPVPGPANPCSEGLLFYRDRPVILVPRVPGGSLENVTADHCLEIGGALAGMHESAASLAVHRKPHRDAEWLNRVAAEVSPHLAPEQWALLDRELQQALLVPWSDLPGGWGHFDLFIDNALFADNHLAGIIDFYHACEDCWLIDLAICLNDWTTEAGAYDLSRAKALLKGYQKLRPLLPAERQYLVAALRMGCLRFWLSRLRTWHLGGYQSSARAGDAYKDPREFEERLRYLRSFETRFNDIV